MGWLSDLREMRELRESVQVALAFRVAAERERDAARVTADALATDNIRLARHLEQDELLLADAREVFSNSIQMTQPGTGGYRILADWLIRHQALRP